MVPRKPIARQLKSLSQAVKMASRLFPSFDCSVFFPVSTSRLAQLEERNSRKSLSRGRRSQPWPSLTYLRDQHNWATSFSNPDIFPLVGHGYYSHVLPMSWVGDDVSVVT